MVHRTQSDCSAGQTSGLASGRASCSSSTTGQLNMGPQSKAASSSASSEKSGRCRSFANALTRRKPLDCRTETHLNRCLNLIDLTALGVGSTLGLGLYVLAGQVASNKAGPAVVISFAMAALASAFSALCYAEFAGRVPRAGSAYAYSYITVGEFVAFIIGWNLILEYVIGASSVARGFSGYICFVYNHVAESLSQQQASSIAETTANETTTMRLPAATMTPLASGANVTNSVGAASLVGSQLLLAASPDISSSGGGGLISSIVNYVAEYFDWPSVAIIIVITAFILFGVKESTNVTLAFTAVNLLVVLAVVISSLGYLDLHNWRLSKSEVPAGYGEGGFLPYGWSGVLAGSATCFFGFIGFDTIASSAEEARNPKRNVPLSILLSLSISFIAYMAVAIVQTLIWPYYDQNRVTILPHIFGKLDMPLAYWIVLLGAIAGLASSQLGGMYPLPRILYSMAHDKLIYGSLAHINKRLKLPVRATIVGSIFVAILACLLDIQDLADMVSIGTLAAYSLVSLSVLILRYEDQSDAIDDSTNLAEHLGLTERLDDELDEHNSNSNNGGNRAQNDAHLAITMKSQCQSFGGGGGGDGIKDSLTASKTAKEHSLLAIAPAHLHPANSIKVTEVLGPQKDLMSLRASQFQTSDQTRQPQCAPKRTKQSGSLLDLLIVWRTQDDALEAQLMRPNDRTSRQSKLLIGAIVFLCIALDFVALCLTSGLLEGNNYTTTSGDNTGQQNHHHPMLVDPRLLLISAGCILFVALASALLMLSRLPASKTTQRDLFQVPLVPLIPTLSILVNTFLMLNLSYLTWLRFAVWMAFGLFIYFTYGIWNSRGHLLRLGV